MNTAQVCFLVQTARRKISQEVARPEHRLRCLVAHANMIDSLTQTLTTSVAKKQQEKWVSTSSSDRAVPQSVLPQQQRPETIVEEMECDSDENDSDCDSEDDEIEWNQDIDYMYQYRRLDAEEEEGEYEADDFGCDGGPLMRTASHSPPELIDDSGSDSEEEDEIASLSPIKQHFIPTTRSNKANNDSYDVLLSMLMFPE